MKTTKNKTIQDISILASGLFHWFVLAANGCCLSGQKSTKPTALMQEREQGLPDAAIIDTSRLDTDIENLAIADTSNLEELFDEHKQDATIHSSYSEGSDKANKQPIKAENDDSESSSGLYQSNPLVNRSNPIAPAIAEGDVDGSNNDTDQYQKMDSNSANVEGSGHTEDTIQHNMLPDNKDNNLSPLLQNFKNEINTLKNTT